MNISHCADFNTVIRGLLLTAEAYPTRAEKPSSPIFGPGLFVTLEKCVGNLEVREKEISKFASPEHKQLLADCAPLRIAMVEMENKVHSYYYYYRSANPKPSGHRAYTQRVCSHTMGPLT